MAHGKDSGKCSCFKQQEFLIKENSRRGALGIELKTII
jgi:hypothetical protein